MKVSSQNPLLILGGGLIGLSLAHALALKGKKVEVLSRNRNEAAGFVAAGMLAPHAEGLQGKILELGQQSLNLIPNWVKQIETSSGMSCGLRQCGVLVPFTSEHQLNEYPTACFGKKLNRSDLEKETPGIAEHWKSGLLFEQDGQIDNRRQLMRALEKACVELGVKFQEGVRVLKLVHNGSYLEGINIQSAEGEELYIKSRQAIICSGAWSNQLLKDLTIYPVKGQMMSIQGPRNSLKRIIFGPGTYLVPREDGLIVIGATSEPEAGFREGLTPFGQRQLKAGIHNLIPIANSWPTMERWWGFRPCTPDEKPIIGAHSLEGVWIATGHYRNGVLLAAITAHLLSKCICKEKLDDYENDLLLSFTFNRFAEKLIMTHQY